GGSRGRARSRRVSSCVQLYERSYIEIFRQLRPASLQAREGADDGSRWRGPDRPPWLSCREKEWVRRLGASPPMRMSASWFGSWTHRIQGRGAIDPRPESGLPSDRHPDRTKRAVVLEAVKVWPGKGGGCCPSCQRPRSGWSHSRHGDPVRDVSLSSKAVRRRWLSGAGIQHRASQSPPASERGNRQALRSGQRVCCLVQTLDCRAHACLAQSLPKARQGLGEAQSKSACVPAPRLNSAHAQKTL